MKSVHSVDEYIAQAPEEAQQKLQELRAAIRFPLDEKLPLDLIKKLVQARVRKNDEAEKKK